MDPFTLYMLAVAPMIKLALVASGWLLLCAVVLLGDSNSRKTTAYIGLLMVVLGLVIPTPGGLRDASDYLLDRQEANVIEDC
jgi:hypothetical protein